MKTLITPAEAVTLAFGTGEYVAPEAIAEADIAAAERRYIVPVVGRKLHARLAEGGYAEFTAEYLAAPVALWTRVLGPPGGGVAAGPWRAGGAAPPPAAAPPPPPAPGAPGPSASRGGTCTRDSAGPWLRTPTVPSPRPTPNACGSCSRCGRKPARSCASPRNISRRTRSVSRNTIRKRIF